MADALNRTEFANRHTIYNANGSTTTGSFARGEGDPATGNRDVDAAYDWTGATYDYYASNFGRDSYDGAGAKLVSFVHYGVGYENAFWDGFEMVYGDGFAVNDVTAHELTHAVTERTAGLEYQDHPPGALNESISDQAGWDVDPGDSTMGEDLPIGAIRDMRNPGAFGQPASASQYVCTASDNGGVHTNSGIPNKVYANLVDSLGRSGAEQVRYRAQTVYMGPTATFADARAAEEQAASDLGLERRDGRQRLAGAGRHGLLAASLLRADRAAARAERSAPPPPGRPSRRSGAAERAPQDVAQRALVVGGAPVSASGGSPIRSASRRAPRRPRVTLSIFTRRSCSAGSRSTSPRSSRRSTIPVTFELSQRSAHGEVAHRLGLVGFERLSAMSCGGARSNSARCAMNARAWRAE